MKILFLQLVFILHFAKGYDCTGGEGECACQHFANQAAFKEQNLALNRPISVINTLIGWCFNPNCWNERHAVDGDLTTPFCTSDKIQNQNIWLKVDLQDEYQIHTVALHLRTDPRISNRRKDFRVHVDSNVQMTSSQVCFEWPGQLPDKASIFVPCCSPVRGRYVMLWKPDTIKQEPNILTICEFEVFQESPVANSKLEDKSIFCSASEKQTNTEDRRTQTTVDMKTKTLSPGNESSWRKEYTTVDTKTNEPFHFKTPSLGDESGWRREYTYALAGGILLLLLVTSCACFKKNHQGNQVQDSTSISNSSNEAVDQPQMETIERDEESQGSTSSSDSEEESDPGEEDFFLCCTI